MQAGVATCEFLYGRPLVYLVVVPDDDDLAAYCVKQLGEEVPHLCGSDVLAVQFEVEVYLFFHRAHRYGGDGTHAAVGKPVGERRGGSPGAPGGNARRDEQKSRLVYEDEVGTQPCGVFLPGATRPPPSGRSGLGRAEPRASQTSGGSSPSGQGSFLCDHGGT